MDGWTKTGDCYWRDDAGALWLAESWQNDDTGEVKTVQTKIEDPPAPET